MFHFKLIGGYFLLMMSLCLLMHAHEGHHAFSPFSPETNFLTDEAKDAGRLAGWLGGIGRFHLLFLHFPIALIVMTVVAEWLRIWFGNPLFDHAARFMLLAAAIFALPTALLGLAFGYGQVYEGVTLELYVWHRYFGLITAGLAIITALLRELYVRQQTSSLTSYYICLFLLFLCVSLTGAFGGSLAFGLDVW